MRELPNSRLVEASSILELRLSPERLTGEIVFFIDECFEGSGGRPKARGRKSSPSTNGSSKSASRRRPVN